MPASKMKSIAKGRRNVYEKLRGKGFSKSSAAKIANAGKSKAGRHSMAKKGARTRKAKGR